MINHFCDVILTSPFEAFHSGIHSGFDMYFGKRLRELRLFCYQSWQIDSQIDEFFTCKTCLDLINVLSNLIEIDVGISIHSYGKNENINKEECNSLAVKRHFLQQFVFF